MQSKNIKIPFTLSRERRYGELHQHHHFDYHDIKKQHDGDWHSHIIDTVYENEKAINGKTQIGKLIRAAYHAVANIQDYEIDHGENRDDVRVYGLRKIATGKIYQISIFVSSGKFTCSCPNFKNHPELPCKHILLIAGVKNHEIKINT